MSSLGKTVASQKTILVKVLGGVFATIIAPILVTYLIKYLEREDSTSGPTGAARISANVADKDKKPSPVPETLDDGLDKTEVAEVTRQGTLAPPSEAPADVLPPLDEGWMKKVRVLPFDAQLKEVAEEMKRRNPGFDGTIGIRRNEGVELEVTSNDVVDLMPLRAIPKLISLRFKGTEPRSGKLTDLSPLKGLELALLAVINCRVHDLSPLRGMPLHELSVAGTEVRDLSPLRGMTFNNLLGLNFNPQIRDIGPLADVRLQALFMYGVPANLTPLTNVGIKNIYLDVTPERLPQLRAIKSLEMINQSPAAEFWKEQEE